MVRKDNILLKYFLDTLLLKIGRVGGNKWWDEGHWKVPVYNLERWQGYKKFKRRYTIPIRRRTWSVDFN